MCKCNLYKHQGVKLSNIREIVQAKFKFFHQKRIQILDYYIKVTKDPHLRLAKFYESFDLYEKIAEESPEQYAEYLSARSKLAGILLTVGDQGKQMPVKI